MKGATGRDLSGGFFVGGSVLILTAPFAWAIAGAGDAGAGWGSALGAVLAGLAVISIGLYYRYRRNGTIVADERSWQSTLQAGCVSWLVTWLLIILLFSLRFLGIVQVGYDLILLAVWFAMPWTFLALRFAVDRRGDPA